MDAAKEILNVFPPPIAEKIQNSAAFRSGSLEEIRCRIGQSFLLMTSAGERALEHEAVVSSELDYIMERASNYSIHTCENEMKAGYLHTSSGCRIGICGTVTETGLRSVSSLSIRIPHAVTGCAQPLLSKLLKNGMQSTLIISPPGGGKTTLLRDLIRALSLRGYRVAVADERGELAAVHNRRTQFDLGPNTDVMTGGTKAHSCMMLLRSMNPQVLALDEITDPKDVEAAKYAAGCGVALLATAHAADAKSLQDRQLYRSLLRESIFTFAVEIRLAGSERVYQVVEL